MSTGLLATGATGLWKYFGLAGAASRCLSPFFPAVTKAFGPMTEEALAPEPQGSMTTGLNGIFRFPVSGDLQADRVGAPPFVELFTCCAKKGTFLKCPIFRK